jgi:hypothetical protein
MRPPWKPARNINMSSQQEIGNFADEKEANRLVLLPEDHRFYESWNFINHKAFEEEVVEFLRYEEMVRITVVFFYSIYLNFILFFYYIFLFNL